VCLASKPSPAIQAFEERDPRTIEAFERRLDEAVEQIGRFPEAAPVHVRGTRRLVLNPFPYALIYRVSTDKIAVIAVAHTSQRPGYGTRR
jgi:plasmid stabilization system protein ParE